VACNVQLSRVIVGIGPGVNGFQRLVRPRAGHDRILVIKLIAFPSARLVKRRYDPVNFIAVAIVKRHILTQAVRSNLNCIAVVAGYTTAKMKYGTSSTGECLGDVRDVIVASEAVASGLKMRQAVWQ